MLQTLFISFLALLPMGTLIAQSDPSLHILNPIGFVRPGEQFELHAKLVNPADSAVVIARISGGGRSESGSVYENPVDRQALMQEMQVKQQAFRERMRAGIPNNYPVTQGSFPLYPGESLEFVIHTDQMPRVAQPGQDIWFKNLSVKLDVGSYISGSVYADLNTIRIANENEQVDESTFAHLELKNEQAGTMTTDLFAEFDYPSIITAGESFTIEASVTNRYDYYVNLQTSLFMAGGFREWKGEHARSFRFINCEVCQTPPEIILGPGESGSFQLGTFYYENEELFDGDLLLDGFMLSVVDHVGRHELREITSDTLSISVVSTNGIDRRISEGSFEALQVRDLSQTGDQKLVYDPNSGKEWLKLTIGEGYSPQELLRAIGFGGELSGFRLASSEEVENLYLNHLNASGVKLRDYAVYETVSQIEPLQKLVSLFGNIPTVNESLGFSGVVSDEMPARHEATSQYTIITLKVTNQPPQSALLLNSDQGLNKSRRPIESHLEEYTGYWLVR